MWNTLGSKSDYNDEAIANGCNVVHIMNCTGRYALLPVPCVMITRKLISGPAAVCLSLSSFSATCLLCFKINSDSNRCLWDPKKIYDE